MGLWDYIDAGLNWAGDNSKGISTIGNLALGGLSVYNSHKASETASNFYDAAGETAKKRWDMISPLEKAKVDAELKMLATRAETPIDRDQLYTERLSTSLNNQILEFQNSLVPQQGAFETELMKYRQENLPKEQGLYTQNLDIQSKALDMTSKDMDTYEKYRGVEDEYYRQSMEGIDPGTEANRAQADVAHAFAGTMAAANRELARRGVGPDAAGYQGKINSNAIEQAKAVGGAMTTARRYAEDVNYNRLGSAMNARQRLSPATTGSITAPSGSVLPATTAINNPMGGVNSSYDPTSTYYSLGNVAASGATNSSNTGWDLIQRGLNG